MQKEKNIVESNSISVKFLIHISLLICDLQSIISALPLPHHYFIQFHELRVPKLL